MCRFHMTTFAGAVWKFSLVLWGYIWEPAKVLQIGLRPATLLKKRLWDRCFSVNFTKMFRTPFVSERLRWLLLCNVPIIHRHLDNSEAFFIGFYYWFQNSCSSNEQNVTGNEQKVSSNEQNQTKNGILSGKW